jgi:hypothetical protein
MHSKKLEHLFNSTVSRDHKQRRCTRYKLILYCLIYERTLAFFGYSEHNKLYIIQPTSDCVVDHILLIDIYSWMLKAIQSYLDLGVAMDTVINYTPLNFCIIVWSCDSSTLCNLCSTHIYNGGMLQGTHSTSYKKSIKFKHTIYILRYFC